MGSDRGVLSRACVEMAIRLLNAPLPATHPLTPRLTAALLHCLLLPRLSGSQNAWAARKLRAQVSAGAAAPESVTRLLPAALLVQHDYEEPLVRQGSQLMHSHYFRVRPLYSLSDEFATLPS